MSDYRRWISYIYAYENGVRKRNAGYAKLELKDGNLTMTLHVTPDNREGKYRVCLYKNQPGHREGVALGEMEKKCGGDCARFAEDAADLGGSGLLFQEMNGLLLYDESGKCLISSWEDAPVEMSAIQDIIAMLGRQKNAQEQGARKAGGASEKAEQQYAGGRPAEAKKERAPESDEAADGESAGGSREQRTEKEADKSGKESAATASVELREKEQEKVKSVTALSVGEEREQEQTVLQPAGEIIHMERDKEISAAIKENKECGEQGECETQRECGEQGECETQGECEEQKGCGAENGESEKQQKVAIKKDEAPKPGRLESRIFSCLPAMYPFEHQEFERSVRMEPQDIGLLPREMWKYAGNSFLLHSYYAYHHILFARKVRKEQRSCYLLLPGVYEPKEQHMAQLFGFSRFCPVRKKTLQQGDFGYWYMEVGFSGDAPEDSPESVFSASERRAAGNTSSESRE